MAVAVAVAVAVSGGGAVAVAVPVAGLTKRFFNHIQKDFLINVWGYPVLTPMSEHVGAILFCTFFFLVGPMWRQAICLRQLLLVRREHGIKIFSKREHATSVKF